jgi:hypothetical protein
VPSALKLGSQKRINNFIQFGRLYSGTQTQYISIGVQARPLGTELVVTQRRSNPLYFVGGDAHADTGIAYQNAALGFTPDYRFSHRPGNIRVVHGICSMTTGILTGVTTFGHQFDDCLLQR